MSLSTNIEPTRPTNPPSLEPSSDELLRLAKRGMKLFPCKAGGKTPLLVGWQAKATDDPAQLRRWFAEYRGCNWGMKTGQDSRVLVLDIDGEEAAPAVQEFCREHGEDWMHTLTATTGRENGRHLYFRYPEGAQIRNGVSKIGSKLDVRGEGGLVIVPPSVHENGRRYKWMNCTDSIATVPEWLLQRLTPDTVGGAGQQTRRVLPSRAPKDGPILEGRRGDTLFKIGSGMRGRGKEHRDIEAAMLHINASRCPDPLPIDKVKRSAASAARYPAGNVDELPLAEFVVRAIAENARWQEVRLNETAARYRTPLFEFVRRMKGRPEFAKISPLVAAKRLDPILAEGTAHPWEHHFASLHDDPRAEFIRTWEAVRTSAKDGPLEVAFSEACQRPLAPLLCYSSKYATFVSVAGYLQLRRPREPIMLPLRQVGELLDCDRSMVTVYRNWAVRDGLMRETCAEVPHSRATEFSFDLGLWNWTSGEQIQSFAPDPQEASDGTGVSGANGDDGYSGMEENGKKGRT